MRREESLLIVKEDNLITKIIKGLKKILKIKQEEESINRKAEVLQTEKIEMKLKQNIGFEELQKLEKNILNDLSYINNLNEDELDSLDEYYDMRINELENILNDKKSRYYKLISARKI